ncbi:hypothetical protein [Shewanella sp. SW24]|uniref:hypothetical protein n=1 Tax=Shewanella sp. SW24 TaxID=2912815 RepID=UPI0021D856C9|nr:hypothetical protein [Shewanella sp. SW24]MCU7986263.1 hypothetical protein [Shewanella sp. SW24]
MASYSIQAKSFFSFYSTQNKTARIFLCKPLFYLAGVAGLEPATIGFGDGNLKNKNQLDKKFVRKLKSKKTSDKHMIFDVLHD